MSGRKLVVNFQAFDEREMHRKMVGAMVYSLLLFGLVIYLWENETFAIAPNSNGLHYDQILPKIYFERVYIFFLLPKNVTFKPVNSYKIIKMLIYQNLHSI